MQIPLSHIVLSLNDPVAVARQKDAFSLALRFRLDYEGFGPLVVELVLETFRIGW